MLDVLLRGFTNLLREMELMISQLVSRGLLLGEVPCRRHPGGGQQHPGLVVAAHRSLQKIGLISKKSNMIHVSDLIIRISVITSSHRNNVI